MNSASKLLAAIQSHGCDATTIRDAAHEATHAKQTAMTGRWTRNNVHDAIERLARLKAERPSAVMLMLIRYELQARAVEMLVCNEFGEPYDVKEWAFTCWMETSKAYRVDMGKVDDIAEAIEITAGQWPTMNLFNRVMAIRGKKPSRRAKEVLP